VTNDYAEAGLTRFSTAAADGKIFFRDFALKVGAGGGGAPGSGVVEQY
jgi:hypothetical protein